MQTRGYARRRCASDPDYQIESQCDWWIKKCSIRNWGGHANVQSVWIIFYPSLCAIAVFQWSLCCFSDLWIDLNALCVSGCNWCVLILMCTDVYWCAPTTRLSQISWHPESSDSISVARAKWTRLWCTMAFSHWSGQLGMWSGLDNKICTGVVRRCGVLVIAMLFCMLSRHQLLIANLSFGGEPASCWNLVFSIWLCPCHIARHDRV